MNGRVRTLLLIGAVNGLLYVLLSAFAAHGLKNIASAEQLAWFKTAAHYQGIHALALLATGLLLQQFAKTSFYVSGVLMLLGIVIFSGSLYAMALGAPRWFGAITPIGGVTLVTAWLYMLVGLMQKDA